MRVYGLALIASAVVVGACGGGDKTTTKSSDTALGPAAANTTAVTPPTGGSAAKKPATGKTVSVNMVGDGTTYKFDPANITIKTGDNIKWIMVSGGPHNVSFDPAEVPPAAKAQLMANMDNQMGELMGPLLQNAGETYEISFAGVPPGTYNFHCTPHLMMNMKGTITVTP